MIVIEIFQSQIRPEIAKGVLIIIATMIFVAIALAIYIFLYAERTAARYFRNKGFKFDFGLAPRQEVIDKFGDEVGDIIIDERKLVFFRFGWVWAVPGAIITLIVIHLLGRI